MPRKIQPLAPTAEKIATAAKAEKARKATSKKALKQSTKTDKPTAPAKAEPTPDQIAAKRLIEAAAALESMRVDYDTLVRADALTGGESTFEEYLANQGYNPDGTVKTDDKPGYDGPMVALKSARLHYVAAKNGILCNGDELALLCGRYSRSVVVRGLIRAMKLESNPYSHLNPGQQSMNLRNKARGLVKNGMLKIAEIETALAAEAEQTKE